MKNFSNNYDEIIEKFISTKFIFYDPIMNVSVFESVLLLRNGQTVTIIHYRDENNYNKPYKTNIENIDNNTFYKMI